MGRTLVANCLFALYASAAQAQTLQVPACGTLTASVLPVPQVFAWSGADAGDTVLAVLCVNYTGGIIDGVAGDNAGNTYQVSTATFTTLGSGLLQCAPYVAFGVDAGINAIYFNLQSPGVSKVQSATLSVVGLSGVPPFSLASAAGAFAPYTVSTTTTVDAGTLLIAVGAASTPLNPSPPLAALDTCGQVVTAWGIASSTAPASASFTGGAFDTTVLLLLTFGPAISVDGGAIVPDAGGTFSDAGASDAGAGQDAGIADAGASGDAGLMADAGAATPYLAGGDAAVANLSCGTGGGTRSALELVAAVALAAVSRRRRDRWVPSAR